MNKRLRSGTKIRLGEPQQQVKEKIVTIQFGGIDAFGVILHSMIMDIICLVLFITDHQLRNLELFKRIQRI